MFEKLGIVTNIWSEEVENGERFDALMVEFGANGFKDMEYAKAITSATPNSGNLFNTSNPLCPNHRCGIQNHL